MNTEILLYCIRMAFLGYKGRVSRAIFWGVYGIGMIITKMIVALIGLSENPSDPNPVILVGSVLFVTVPVTLALIGRLHDLGHSGWWLIPAVLLGVWIGNSVESLTQSVKIVSISPLILGAVYVGFWPSQTGKNKWGEENTWDTD